MTSEPLKASDIPWAGPSLTTERPSMSSWLDQAGVAALGATSAPADVELALVRLRELLPAGLDPIARATLRLEVRDRLHNQGVSRTARLIDAALAPPKLAPKTRADKSPPDKQGRAVQFDDPEPWGDPVDGAQALDAIASTFARYLALPKHAPLALALWVLHCYAFEAAFTSPFLAITSPEKRCGKTLLLITLGALVPRRLFASNITPAVLFRTIEKYRPTLLIDEADTFIRDNEELRGVLNSGHTRTTAVTIRAVGDDHDPRAFSTWCPKSIALIGKLPGTLTDRAIEVRMRRRTAGERVERLRQDRIEAECLALRRQAARWTADHLADLQAADPAMPPGLHDRAADCWRPLFALADQIGERWPSLAREAALGLSAQEPEDEASTTLLRDIRATFQEDGNPAVLASSALIERLLALEDRPWGEWSHGRPLSPAKLARMLAGYGIYPAGNVRIGPKVSKGYRRDAFAEAWERYLGVVEPLQRNKPNDNGHAPAISSRYTDADCSALKSVTNPMNTEASYLVATSETGESAASPMLSDDALPLLESREEYEV